MFGSAGLSLLKHFVLLAAALGASGCTLVQGSRLVAPESAGFGKVSANLYVEAGSDEAIRIALGIATASAESAIRAAYGNVTSRPMEMFARLQIAAWWWKLPQWFDEGVAVAVSESPEHSESHWELLGQSGIPRPTRTELHTLRTMTQWDDAVGRYGEKQNPERRLEGKPEIRPVCMAAGHEIRSWLAAAGQTRLPTLIAQLNGDQDFDEAYHEAGGTP